MFKIDAAKYQNDKKDIFELTEKIVISILQYFFIAFILTVGIGYLFGFRAYLVVSGSSEPNIMTGSLVVDYKCQYSELKVGDFVTFTITGNTKTTHKIVLMKEEGEYFEAGEVITFTNNGVTFTKTIGSRCQFVAQAVNFSEDSNPLIQCFNYKNINGKVIFSFTNLGKTIFYLRNNFIQFITYVIIAYLGVEIIKFAPYYIRLF